MWVLHWICGKIIHDKIRSDNIRESGEVTPIIETMVKNILSWFKHVKRSLVNFIVKSVDPMGYSQITRGRGRPKKL